MRGSLYALRWEVLERDQFSCVYCGQTAPGVKVHVDLLVAHNAGGTDAMENLVTACDACTLGKSDALRHRTIGPPRKQRVRVDGLMDAITDALRTNGPMTGSRLATVLGRNRSSIASKLFSRPDVFERTDPYGGSGGGGVVYRLKG